MKRWFSAILVLALVMAWPLILVAQEDEDADSMDYSVDEEEAEEDAEAEEENPIAGDELGEEAITEEEYAEEEAKEEVDAPTEDAVGVETYWGTEGLQEVEKGFYLNARFGYLVYFMDIGNVSSSTAPVGVTIGFGLGYDIIDKLLSIETGLLASFHQADIYDSTINAPAVDSKVNGDFMLMRVPIAINLNYFTTKRIELFAAPTGGLVYNAQAIDGYDAKGAEKEGAKIDYYGGLRTGIEYYTGLRHFSLSFELEADYVISAGALAFMNTLALKYTF